MTDKQQKQIYDIYQTYSSKIRSLIIDLEVTDKEFPTAVLNEIRAIMNHLAICMQLDEEGGSEQDIDIQIDKAQEHLKRALYDCYKYLCISMDDSYVDFFHKMRHTDLSSLDNGDFVRKVTKRRYLARDALRVAKKREKDKAVYSINDVTEAFEKAYVEYDKMDRAIMKKLDLAQAAKRKQIINTCIEIFASAVIGAIIGKII